MTSRFTIDLLHPGGLARTPIEWFLGDEGFRRLKFSALGAGALLALVLFAGVLPAQWRLHADLRKITQLRQEGTATAGDLRVLKSDLRALSAEARRQVPWSELLKTFSRELPPALRLQRVELVKPAPPSPGRRAKGPAPSPKTTLAIEALTPLRPGGPPLLDVAHFMAGLMRDPAVNRRFELATWQILPPAGASREGPQFLHVRVDLTERP